MRSVKLVRLLALALIAGGCSDSIGPGSLTGKWTEDFTVPGNIFEMNLTVTGATISGTGDWCGEAGPCGILAVAGTAEGTSVHLDLSFTAQFPRASGTTVEHFDGRLTSSRSLVGTISIDGQPAVVSQVGYHRT